MQFPPEPLTQDEQERLWRWEKRSLRFHAVAIPVLFTACLLAFFFSEIAWLRRSLLVLAVVLVGAATMLQLSEKCPRCRAKLRMKSLMRLPARCSYCGVPFERPPDERVRA
jgi:Flp pilus assembly protein TadB